jgi:hypothetical protein
MSKPEALDHHFLGAASDPSLVPRSLREVDGYRRTSDLESVSQYRVLGR